MAKIIVVDDEPDMVELISDMLTPLGYDIVAAFNGKEALEKLKGEKPDLILLDIMMPGLNGIEVKAKLSEDAATASIPVIFLTVKETIQDKIKGFQLGVDDYITKPFDSEELLARIGSILNRRKFYEEISMTDGLTGLYNVHYFKKQIAQFFSLAAADRLERRRHVEEVVHEALARVIVVLHALVEPRLLEHNPVVNAGDSIAVCVGAAQHLAMIRFRPTRQRGQQVVAATRYLC